MELFIALSITGVIGAWVIRFKSTILSISMWLTLMFMIFGLYWILYEDLTYKGSDELSLWDNLFMYIAMILGMSNKYFFDKYRVINSKFELKKFVRPFFISPIIFLLILSFIDVGNFLDIDISSKLKILLFSFMNGFFWTLGLDKIKKKFKDIIKI